MGRHHCRCSNKNYTIIYPDFALIFAVPHLRIVSSFQGSYGIIVDRRSVKRLPSLLKDLLSILAWWRCWRRLFYFIYSGTCTSLSSFLGRLCCSCALKRHWIWFHHRLPCFSCLRYWTRQLRPFWIYCQNYWKARLQFPEVPVWHLSTAPVSAMASLARLHPENFVAPVLSIGREFLLHEARDSNFRPFWIQISIEFSQL